MEGPLAEQSSGWEDLRNAMIVKRWLTLSQVAERLQIDERIIIPWLRDHQLRGFKRDDVWLIEVVPENRTAVLGGIRPI